MSKSTADGVAAPARPLIDGTVKIFMSLAVVAAALLWAMRGPDAVVGALTRALLLLASIAPLIVMGLYLGGLAQGLSDPKRIAPVLGARSGLRGLGLATALGAITPGGPFAAFPIVYALFAAGADVGAVIAYLTSWSLIALHRVIVWEVPLIGPEFAVVRILVSLPLPVAAGLVARLLVARVDWLAPEPPPRRGAAPCPPARRGAAP